MVNVRDRKCRTEGCGTIAVFGVAGTRSAEYCSQHAPDGMIDVRNRNCTTEGCSKRPSFGVAGTKTAEYCAEHAQDGMITVQNRKCKTEGSSMIAACGVVRTKTAEHYVQHNRPRCGVEGYRGRGIALNHYGKEPIGDPCPSGSKHKTVFFPLVQAKPLSGGSRGSRKQVRDINIAPTASEAVANSEMNGLKSAVEGDSSVKTEVQVSF
ncbi:unnamed protein product [Ascophyllum nodosum]